MAISGLKWADPKPGTSIFFQVSHVGAGSQGLGPFSTAFPGHKQGAGWEVEQPRPGARQGSSH